MFQSILFSNFFLGLCYYRFKLICCELTFCCVFMLSLGPALCALLHCSEVPLELLFYFPSKRMPPSVLYCALWRLQFIVYSYPLHCTMYSTVYYTALYFEQYSVLHCIVLWTVQCWKSQQYSTGYTWGAQEVVIVSGTKLSIYGDTKVISGITAHCTLQTAHSTMYTVQCTLHRAHYTQHTEHWTLHTAQYTLHSLYCTLQTTHCICTQQTANCTLNTEHCKL